MNQNNSVTLGEKIAVYIALFVFMFVAGFVGLAGIIAFVLIPALLAYSIVRLGYKHLILQASVVLVLYSIAYDNFAEIAVLSILPGISIGVCVRRQKSILYTVSAGALALVLAEGLIYVLNSFRADVAENITKALSEQSAQMVSTLGLSATDSAMILEMLSLYTPSILVLSIAALSYATFWVVQFLLRRRAPEIAMRYPRFRELSASKSCALIWLGSLIVTFLNKGTVGVTAANLAMILSCYIILCGFSVFAYWIGAIKNIVLRIILGFVLIWLSSFVTPMAFMFGMLDMIIHFRNRKRGDA